MNRLKTRFVLLLALGMFLLCLQGIALYRRGMDDMNRSMQVQNELKVSDVDRTIALLESQYPQMMDDYKENLFCKADMSVSVLSSQLTEEGFTGKRLFSDAMVVELEGDHFLYPEEAGNPGMLVPASYASKDWALIPFSDIPESEEGQKTNFLLQKISRAIITSPGFPKRTGNSIFRPA